jgi:hypothetical protein
VACTGPKTPVSQRYRYMILFAPPAVNARPKCVNARPKCINHNVSSRL